MKVQRRAADFQGGAAGIPEFANVDRAMLKETTSTRAAGARARQRAGYAAERRVPLAVPP